MIPDIAAPDITFVDVPAQRARNDPHGDAVGDPDRVLSNGELSHRVGLAAEHLAARGVVPGDVVAVRLPNCVEFVVAMFAAWRLGCVVTPFNPASPGASARRWRDSTCASSTPTVVTSLGARWGRWHQRTRGDGRGYLDLPEQTCRTIVDGWLRTGDLGTLDDDGYLFLLGRSKEMIIRGGENIYPREIEEALSAHPDIADVAVIGKPDPIWREVVVAFAAAPQGGRDGLVDEIHTLAAAQLSAYKRPAEIAVFDALPLTATGKVDKPALRALVD